MQEYGIFSDEGCIDDGFYSIEEATARLAEYSAEDELEVEEICPDHPGQPKDFCEECEEADFCEECEECDDDDE